MRITRTFDYLQSLQNDYLDLSTLAAICGVHVTTIRRALHNGEFAGHVLRSGKGGKYFIHKDALSGIIVTH